MSVLILATVGVMLTGNFFFEVPDKYEDVYEQAVNNCHNRSPEQIDLSIVRKLIHIENNFFSVHDIPEELRGMLLAAACNESGYDPEARGDWRTRDGRRVPMARGIVQMWPWWESAYNIDRNNYEQSATAWLQHIATLKAKNERYNRCPSTFSIVRRWIAAWVQTTRGRVNRQNRYRCYQTPSHYRVLRRWQEDIEKLKTMNKCTIEIEIHGIKIFDVPC
jgi:hypothetical protein